MSALGQISDPDLRAILIALKYEIISSVNCAQVGTILGFDAAKQTARIQLNVRRVVYNKPQALKSGLQLDPNFVDYPVLTDCPVFVHSGGGAVVTLPVTAGDSCLVFFGDRDIDNWFEAGGTAPPNSARMHSLSDAFALVGFRNKTNPVSDYSTTDAEIKNAGGKIQVAAKLGLSNEATSLLIALTDVMNTFTSTVTALTALNAKTGPSAATEIAAVATAVATTQAVIDSLLK